MYMYIVLFNIIYIQRNIQRNTYNIVIYATKNFISNLSSVDLLTFAVKLKLNYEILNSRALSRL